MEACGNREHSTSRGTLRDETHSGITRRRFLSTSAKGIGLSALLSGLPTGWVGSVFADDGPETSDLKIGIIALTDCSSIVIAHEKGLFKKFGINSVVSKGASWAAIRDALSNGDIQATHMLLGMPIASTMGLAGSPQKPMIVPWLLNRNGQAITLANKYRGDQRGSGSAKAVCRRSEGQRDATFVCHDLSAGNARDVDTLLSRRRRDKPG